MSGQKGQDIFPQWENDGNAAASARSAVARAGKINGCKRVYVCCVAAAAAWELEGGRGKSIGATAQKKGDVSDDAAVGENARRAADAELFTLVHYILHGNSPSLCIHGKWLSVHTFCALQPLECRLSLSSLLS